MYLSSRNAPVGSQQEPDTDVENAASAGAIVGYDQQQSRRASQTGVQEEIGSLETKSPVRPVSLIGRRGVGVKEKRDGRERKREMDSIYSTW